MFIFAILLPFLISLVLTQLIRKLSLRFGLVDSPDGHRKLHSNVTPLGGGVAILLSFLASVGIYLFFTLPGSELISQQIRFSIGLCGAATLICFVGLLDDRFDIRGRQKLAAQVASIFLIVLGGLRIDSIEAFDYRIELGLLAIPFTVMWLLGAINALNLIDGVDGLAGTVGVVLSITIGALALLSGHPGDALYSWILLGSILGFLVFNLPPAKIYMGDAGSMLIGLVLGVLAIRGSIKGPATVALTAPTAIWAILAFDVLMAIFRRKLTGQSLYVSDRSHFHHVLQKRGYSVLGIVGTIAVLCSVCAMGALASVAFKSELMAIATTSCVLIVMVITGFFGRSECGLLLRKLKSLSVSLVRLPNSSPAKSVPLCSRFHGNREWEVLWQSLVDYANRFDLSIVRLNVSSPSIGEEYHATWERKERPSLTRLWQTEIPLFQGELCVGRLTVAGGVGEGSTVSWMSELIEGLKPFEVQMTSLLEDQIELQDAEQMEEVFS